MAWQSILTGLWLFLPAYVANMSPVFTAKFFPKWNTPIDGGRMHKDGARVLGDGKTWRGLVGGGVFAGLTALVVAFFSWQLDPPTWMAPGHFGINGGTPVGPCDDGGNASSECAGPPLTESPLYVFLFGFVVGIFALAGDAIESFFKRRRGKERGAPWIPFDQLDFVVFGLLGMFVASPLLADGYLETVLWSDGVALGTIVIGTVVLHLLVNRIGYWLKLKDVPW